MNGFSLKAKITALERTPLRWFLAGLASMALSFARKRLTLIYTDSDGDWVLRQSGKVLFNRVYSSVPVLDLCEQVQDLWCFGYQIKAGDVVVDIGAGVGDDALVLSQMVGPSGRVIAIEANPKTFRCLLKTVKANNLRNVTPLNVAASDREGHTFIEEENNWLANRTGAAKGALVSAKVLDSVLREANVEKIDLVKMNIEGAESAALRGAAQTLSSAHNWVISCHDFMAHLPGHENSATYSDVTAALRQAGLEILSARVDPRPWVRYYVYAKKR